MKEQAEKNFNKVLKYQETITGKKRKEIFDEFLDSIPLKQIL